MVRAYSTYGRQTAVTPQSQPIPGRESEMVANNAGGFGFVMDDWARLSRFLLLGSEKGTYYVGETRLTEQNAGVVIRCLKQDGPRVVEMARDINVRNRAPKTDQQLFTLALAMKHGDEATKRAVRDAAPQMLRTGTHLLHFVAMLDNLGGWNRSKRRIVSDWFNGDADHVAYQVIKYANRDGWTQRDALRVAHVKPASPAHDATFAWAARKPTAGAVIETGEAREVPKVLQNYAHLHLMEGSPIEKALWGISHGLPREVLPTEALGDVSVQAALLPGMPLHALIRNLGNMTASGLLTQAEHAQIVAKKITDMDSLRRARVHPFAVLLATWVYKGGSGVRGGKTWTPSKIVLSALEDAYDLAFDFVAPTNKRILVGVDISGSMTMNCIGAPISAATAATAMAITLARLEPQATVVQFDTEVAQILSITKRTGIASLENTRGGGTDVSAPIRWAMGSAAPAIGGPWGYNLSGRNRSASVAKVTEYDAFVILTDNETWAGKMHNSQALETYRRQVNRNAKLVVCAMAANHASVVDPNDPLSLGAAGLDSALPGLVSEFVGG